MGKSILGRSCMRRWKESMVTQVWGESWLNEFLQSRAGFSQVSWNTLKPDKIWKPDTFNLLVAIIQQSNIRLEETCKYGWKNSVIAIIVVEWALLWSRRPAFECSWLTWGGKRLSGLFSSETSTNTTSVQRQTSLLRRGRVFSSVLSKLQPHLQSDSKCLHSRVDNVPFPAQSWEINGKYAKIR